MESRTPWGAGHSGCCLELATACGCSTSQFFSFTNLFCTLTCPTIRSLIRCCFLHLVPFMAAVAIFPTPHASGPRLYRVLSNFLLLLFFWGFLYFYAVFPYQYLFSNTTTYALRFDILYLVENVVLVALVGILSLRVQYPWKMIYLHLLGASALYALSSAVANTAIDPEAMSTERYMVLGLTASACWFVWVPVRAQQITKAEARAARFDTGQGSQASAWAMLVVVMISVPLVWELFQKDETAGMRRFRLLVAIAAIVCLATVAYIKEHFAKSELISQLSLANDRLHLAVEAGKSVGWEWDLKTGRLSWFGDLQTMFGIPSDTFVGRREDSLSLRAPGRPRVGGQSERGCQAKPKAICGGVPRRPG